jgi:DNA-binding transcriptional LysR family regulator
MRVENARCTASGNTVSRRQSGLEARLVLRDHHFVGLTPEGEKVLTWGRQILVDYTSLRKDLSRLRRGLVWTLRLGVIPPTMPAVSFLTP